MQFNPLLSRILTRRALIYAFLLFGLNLYFCHELFRVEYLRFFDSNEGTMIAIARFWTEHPGARWFPWFNAGLPIENTYMPLVPALAALAAAAGRISPAHAVHIVTAVFYCLGPAGWFWLAWKWWGNRESALAAALLYTLISPTALLFPYLRADLTSITGPRRLEDVVAYGDIAHMVSCALLPWALLAIRRALGPVRRAFSLLIAVAAAAGVVLANAFGLVSLSFAVLALLLASDQRRIGRVAALGGITYLAICGWLTPSLLLTIWRNSPTVEGDYRFRLATAGDWLIVLCGLLLAWLVLRRRSFEVRFTVILAWMFTAPVLLDAALGTAVLPQPMRYHVEADAALCLVIAAAVARFPLRAIQATAAVGLVLIVPQAREFRRAARDLLRPGDFPNSIQYKISRWIDRNLPGLRTMPAADTIFWFNVVSDNPQFSGGHEPLAVNWMQRVAVFTIYSDMNAGPRAADVSVFWLKAFGNHAVSVPGEKSRQHFYFAHPHKFDGVLPVLWHEEDDTIYAVPQRSKSLAHVIPAAALVRRRPEHGLDIAPAQAYVRALEDPSLPEAAIDWSSPDAGRVRAAIAPGQVISVQINWDPGWTATNATVQADALGMIVLKPACTGACEMDLTFTGGIERNLCRVLSLALWAVLIGWAALRRESPRIRGAALPE